MCLKKISYIYFVFSLLVLTGCASTFPLQKNITTVPVASHVNLDLSCLNLSSMSGTYLQKINTILKNKSGGQKYIISVYLTVDKQKINAIALNDVAGRLYQLTWRPGLLTWIKSKYIPAALKPENIIADFLVTHLPIQQLNVALSGAVVEEKLSKKTKVRLIKNATGILREIIYSKRLDGIWGEIVITNPQLGYSLNIQTVKQ